MAGGNWESQNKNRPGAYINFKAVPKPLSSVGSRGIVTMPVALDWGPQGELFEILSTDMQDGKSLSKIGYTAMTEGAQVVREALRGCYKALLYRVDKGGTKATATLNSLTATAKYFGICGNNISVAILESNKESDDDTPFYDVVTYYNTIEQDRQTVKEIAELVSNDWVDFSGTGALQKNAGMNLSSGTNGTINNDTYATYLNEIKKPQWQVLGLPNVTDTSVIQSVCDFIKNQRANVGKKVTAVVYNYAQADHEAIISVNQGYETDDEVIDAQTFVATIAGLSAGADINESLTYHEIENATKIVNQLTDEEIEAALVNGKLVLSVRSDGAIVIEKDINTLHTFTVEKDYQFSKNRVIRTLDEIANSVRLTWEKSYVGKVDNDDQGRKDYKADLIYYFTELQRLRAIQNFDSSTDIDVLPGNDVDSVVVNVHIQPVDAMEKLYMTVMVGAKGSTYTTVSAEVA